MVPPPPRSRRRSPPTGRRRRSRPRPTVSCSGKLATAAARCRRGSICRTTSAGPSSTTSARYRKSRRAAAPVTSRRPADPPAGRSCVSGGRRPRVARVRLASIDLGTNTVRLLVAEVTSGTAAWRTVRAEQRVTRLGEGLRATGTLGDAAAARTAAIVVQYVALARAAGATRVAVVATSAVREAANGRAFVTDLERAAGIAVRVISGEEEARLTLAGIVAGLGPLRGVVIAFDIGGGSTEYILARDGVLTAAASLRLGVVPLAERFPFPGPVEPARAAALRADVEAQLTRELPAVIATTRIDCLVGTAGTVTTLAALDLGLLDYDPARVQGHLLTRAAIERQHRRLAALDLAGRAALPCLEPGRADLILPGIAIVDATLDRLGCERLIVSDWSLREGILAEMAAREV